MNDYTCNNDEHVFIYMATPSQQDFPDDDRCVCGKYTWKEYKKLKKEIEIPPERLEILDYI